MVPQDLLINKGLSVQTCDENELKKQLDNMETGLQNGTLEPDCTAMLELLEATGCTAPPLDHEELSTWTADATAKATSLYATDAERMNPFMLAMARQESKLVGIKTDHKKYSKRRRRSLVIRTDAANNTAKYVNAAKTNPRKTLEKVHEDGYFNTEENIDAAAHRESLVGAFDSAFYKRLYR